MKLTRVALVVSITAAALMAVVSVAGVSDTSVYAVTMGIAVVAMAVNLHRHGIAGSLIPAIFMGINVILAIFLCAWVVKGESWD